MLLFIFSVINILYSIFHRFNTSHVTLYRILVGGYKYSYARFNTSHVTLYLMSAFPSQEVQFRFNTSHVTLYLLRIKFQHGCANSFQYISCYSLSSISFFVNTYNFSFNTSHVTLYRIEKRNLTRFIPCFNTSHVTLYLITERWQRVRQFCFNTSHVTLYPRFREDRLSLPPCFNTSHVTLYLKRPCRLATISNVSIHLMLLFIVVDSKGNISWSKFQYISCYSLS